MSTAAQRERMAHFIVDFEARRDKQGRLIAYLPPANDGGGGFEVAGINVRYHADQAFELKRLIDSGHNAEAEERAAQFIAEYTDVAARWVTDAGEEFFLRDCVFNRGPKGAARILQIALGVGDDGEVGPITRNALSRVPPHVLLPRLRQAREAYEIKVVGKRANLWRGLVNRWDKAEATATMFAGTPYDRPEEPGQAPGTPPEAPEAPPQPGEVPTAAPGSLARLFELLLAALRALFGRSPEAPQPGEPEPEPTPEPQPAGEPRWLTAARRDIGFHEKPDNTGIEVFTDQAHTGHEHDPWCAIFVNAKLEQCGVPGTRSAMARSFERSNRFVKLSGPALGAISTFWRGSKDGGSGHVNFYAGTDPKRGHIGIGGNQGDRVSAAVMDMSRHTGWWWPAGEPTPPIGAVRVDFNNVAGGGKED